MKQLVNEMQKKLGCVCVCGVVVRLWSACVFECEWWANRARGWQLRVCQCGC